MIRQAYTERSAIDGSVMLRAFGCPKGPATACAGGIAIAGHNDGAPQTRVLVINKCPMFKDKTDIEEREYVCCSHDWPDQRPSGMWPTSPAPAPYPVEEDGSSNVD